MARFLIWETWNIKLEKCSFLYVFGVDTHCILWPLDNVSVVVIGCQIALQGKRQIAPT
jgi:hypothetical protein